MKKPFFKAKEKGESAVFVEGAAYTTAVSLRESASPASEAVKGTTGVEYLGLGEDFLSPEEFRDQLRREKRRAERSQAPMSIILFQLSDGVLENRYLLKNFLEALKSRTRETDIKGWVDPKTVGTILLDTNGVGMQRCLASVRQGNESALASVLTGSYPDSIFEELLDDSKTEPDLFLFELDERNRKRSLARRCKRALDVSGALVGLVLFSPIMLVAALAVKLSSPGPVIFKQVRLGRKGRRFNFYKFRSMYADCDHRCHKDYVTKLIEGKHEEVNQGDEGEPCYKLKNDERITPVGRILRRLSIDELPQLFNVLKGEMSLVGPRPPIPYEVEKYQPWHLRRILEIQPGITGLWQVEGRSRTSFNEMVRLDLRYLKNWSLWLDIKILLKTIKAVFEAKGAV
jgi:exopolysaccharide biosynthesis polyprenyl glycosylphosphotransferase